MSRYVAICVLSAAVAAAGCSNTNNNADPTAASSGNTNMEGQYGGAPTFSAADQQFIMDASAGGAYEIQSSRVALNKSSSDSVKHIANQMITDHTKVDKQVAAIASAHGVKAATQPNDSQMAMIKTLKGLNGTAFDSEYLRQQQQAHQETIAKFETESQNGSGELKTLAANTLPTLHMHLDMVDKAMNGNNSTNMGSAR